MEKTINTPVGPCHPEMLAELMTVAGMTVKEVSGMMEFSIISYPTEGWRKENGNWKLSPVSLPLRYNNFIVALSKCGGNVTKAMTYARSEMFLGGKAINLPDRMNRSKPGWSGREPIFTYGRLLKQAEEKLKSLTLTP